MQSLVILCRSSSVYMAGAGAEAGAWDGVLTLLGLGVASAGALSGWLDPAEACWAFLRERMFAAIVASPSRWRAQAGGSTVAKGSTSWVSSKRAGWPIGFGAIRIVKGLGQQVQSGASTPKSPLNLVAHGGNSAWLVEASYANRKNSNVIGGKLASC